MELLIVEDEVKTANSLKSGLEEYGYKVQVAFDGEKGLQLACEHQFNVIIMDLIMPKMNGIELCSEIRKRHIKTPVIMLTALGMTSEKLKGFESGADDYVAKPFDFNELLARVKVAVSRGNTGITQSNSIIHYADLELDLTAREARRGGKKINLTSKEYALLEFFVKHPGKLLTKEVIAEKVWDLNFDTGTNIIEVYVSYLRNKIDKDFSKKLIHTKKGMGYIFREE